MNKELIINAAPQGVEIALLEDKKLVELHNEKTDASFAVGDLYLGKVKKLIPGLNAAFVDVGFENTLIIDYDLVIILTQQVAQDTRFFLLLAQDLCRGCCTLEIMLKAFPALKEVQ